MEFLIPGLELSLIITVVYFLFKINQGQMDKMDGVIHEQLKTLSQRLEQEAIRLKDNTDKAERRLDDSTRLAEDRLKNETTKAEARLAESLSTADKRKVEHLEALESKMALHISGSIATIQTELKYSRERLEDQLNNLRGEVDRLRERVNGSPIAREAP